MSPRSYGDVRRLRESGGKGRNLNLSLPKETSAMLRDAGVVEVRVVVTDEGVLLVPYRGPETPAWARQEER